MWSSVNKTATECFCADVRLPWLSKETFLRPLNTILETQKVRILTKTNYLCYQQLFTVGKKKTKLVLLVRVGSITILVPRARLWFTAPSPPGTHTTRNLNGQQPQDSPEEFNC